MTSEVYRSTGNGTPTLDPEQGRSKCRDEAMESARQNAFLGIFCGTPTPTHGTMPPES